MSGFKDKIVVITGGSSGIGAATAVLFAEKECRLVLTGRNTERLADVKQQCLQHGAPQVETIECDQAEEEAAQKIVDVTLATFGTIHILVNNAGGGNAASLHLDTVLHTEGKTEALDFFYKLMVRSPWQLCGLFAKELIKNKGSIIFNTSILGVIATPTVPQYGLCKAAVNYMTRAVAAELAMHGVRVNAVLPGYTETNIFRTSWGLTEEQSHMAFKSTADKLNCLEKKDILPSDIAKAILFLASDDARTITGVLLPVDAGSMLVTPLMDDIMKNTTKAE